MLNARLQHFLRSVAAMDHTTTNQSVVASTPDNLLDGGTSRSWKACGTHVDVLPVRLPFVQDPGAAS